MKTTKTYRGAKIITHKNRDEGYTAYMFRKGELESFGNRSHQLKGTTIDMAESAVDGMIHDGYMSEAV